MSGLSVARKHRLVPLADTTPGPTYTVELVDPETAQKWLGYNTSNRHINPATVAAYARDMKHGKWVLRGDAIEFSDNPVCLRNGQHRLHAVVLANVTVLFLVGRGVDPKSQDVADTGRKRSFSDQLHLRGIQNASMIAAITRRGAMWDQGTIVNSGTGFKPTETELSAWIERNPEVFDAAALAGRIRKEIGLAPSITGLGYILFRRIDREDANEFMSRLADGVGLAAGSPVLAFRNRWIKERDLGGRIRETEVLALLFLAWNHFRAGNSVTKLQLPKAGLTSANFPIPR